MKYNAEVTYTLLLNGNAVCTICLLPSQFFDKEVWEKLGATAHKRAMLKSSLEYVRENLKLESLSINNSPRSIDSNLSS